MEPRSRLDNLGLFLAILTSIAMFLFAVIWETRWKRMVAALSSEKRSNHELAEQALRDPLTSLPNRTLLNDRLQQALMRCQRNETTVAVLFLDLDNFKNVNDKHGHLVGDQLLIAVGERLRHHLRSSDTAGRLGGDEFVVILELRNPNDAVMMVAERLRRALHVPLLLEPEPITVSTSIGIALSETGVDDPEDLLNEADNALLEAKRSGKDCVIMGTSLRAVETAGHHARS
jgi:diguanylate cyclase